MADDAQSIQSLNWRELFPFTHLFRAFRVAIHPSKLVLGFGLILLVYFGGRVLDVFWPATHDAIYGEIDRYEQEQWNHRPQAMFEEWRDLQRAQNVHEYSVRLVNEKIFPTKEGSPVLYSAEEGEAAVNAAERGEFHSALAAHVIWLRNEELKKAADDRDAAIKTLNQLPIDDGATTAPSNGPLWEQSAVDAQKHDVLVKFDNDARQIEATAEAQLQRLNEITPRPIFDTFFDYESRQFHRIVTSAISWSSSWLEGALGGGTASPVADNVSSNSVLKSIANLTVIGPGWLLRYHFVYFLLFTAWFLIVWAIFGGAIARVAAVHVARDEKISIRQALRFSSAKLLSFVFAPLIPLVIVLVTGAIVAVGGLLMYVPVVGPIVVGVLYILALVAGFVITLVVVGTVGGINLMYPTIAVEGSDSFDAISRSFSYIFARPWRMIFYSGLSLIYGAFCFIFVRYFVFLTLAITHFFTQWFLWGKPGRYWPQIWPAVSDRDLTYQINYHGLAWSEATSAALIAFWVYIVLTFLAAFLVSFYFSANSIIYFLMRREVDATELDDVYLEESDEDFLESPVMASASSAEATANPAAPAPDAPPA